jgi:addiction module HigA family antidote
MTATCHPGEIIREDCLPAMNVTFQQAATGTGIQLERLTDILNCQAAMTQKEAKALSAYIKKDSFATPDEICGTAEMFIRMQQGYYAALKDGPSQA